MGFIPYMERCLDPKAPPSCLLGADPAQLKSVIMRQKISIRF